MTAFLFANFAAGGFNGNSNAPRIHTLKTVDALTAVDDAGYFNSARQHLRVGDLIYVVVVTNLGASNEAVADAGFFVVNSVPALGTDVDVSDVTDIVVTDSGG
jgi:hypothetical protein